MEKGVACCAAGRFVLVELGRLDEAEAALGDSLVAQPNNSLAQNELRYIARLRASGAPTAPAALLPNADKR